MFPVSIFRWCSLNRAGWRLSSLVDATGQATGSASIPACSRRCQDIAPCRISQVMGRDAETGRGCLCLQLFLHASTVFPGAGRFGCSPRKMMACRREMSRTKAQFITTLAGLCARLPTGSTPARHNGLCTATPRRQIHRRIQRAYVTNATLHFSSLVL